MVRAMNRNVSLILYFMTDGKTNSNESGVSKDWETDKGRKL